MRPIEKIQNYSQEFEAIRRDLHQHPEIGFEEERTSTIVATVLSKLGCEVYRRVGITGVIGVVEGAKGKGERIVGLRADMDALPMGEETGLPYASVVENRFHGCGHDGHTAILLAVARYLAETRNFAGRVVLIFQPAEESLGGARAMLANGLFERFPCSVIYALHNWPDGNFGHVRLRSGPMMACADTFHIVIRGRGGHAAFPHKAIDPVLIGTALVQALQSIVSRSADPLEPAVLTVAKFVGGTATNIVADSARLSGSIRCFAKETRELMRRRMREICAGTAASYGAEISAQIEDSFSVLENSSEQVEAVVRGAADIVGLDRVDTSMQPLLASEDFADMLAVVPGAYFLIGTDAGPPVHNPGYRFDDKIIPYAASILARIVEQRLPL